MSRFTRFPLFFLLPLVLGCLLSFSKAVPLSHELNEEFENDDDFGRSEYRSLEERESFLPEDGFRMVPEGASFFAEDPLTQAMYRMASQPSPTKSVHGGDGVGFRSSLGKKIKKAIDAVIAQIKDDDNWEGLKNIVIKIADKAKKGADFISDALLSD